MTRYRTGRRQPPPAGFFQRGKESRRNRLDFARETGKIEQDTSASRQRAGETSPSSTRPVWEREAGVRAAFPKNPGKLWDAKADGVLSLAGNWSKTGADPIFDHSWKIPYPGVAQLVARLLWEQDAGSSSLPTRTIFARKTALIGGFLRFKFNFFSFSYCCSAVIQGSERR